MQTNTRPFIASFFLASIGFLAVHAFVCAETQGNSASFLEEIRAALSQKDALQKSPKEILKAFQASDFPKSSYGLALVLHEPRLKTLRFFSTDKDPGKKILKVLKATHKHPKISQFHLNNPAQCRIQLDFIDKKPTPVEFSSLSQTAVDEHRFEMGVDGLLAVHKKKKFYFLPGDAFIRSYFSLKDIKAHILKSFHQVSFDEIQFFRFKTESYVSYENRWIKLFRGYPVEEPLTIEKVKDRARAAVDTVVKHQKENGQFLYYYDAAHDSFLDHEHPKRNAKNGFYYNELRHAGGAVLLLYDYRLSKNELLLKPIQAAIDWLKKNLVVETLPDGTQDAYLYYNRKSKLGGAGITLYLLSEYQHLTGDKTYEPEARLLKNHLLSQVTASGEFLYYHLYLDKPVTEQNNRDYFSFYYPGEAVCGLAAYLKYVETDAEAKQKILEKLKSAMRFLIEERPKNYGKHYTTLPSDSWLMMGVNEMWDVPALRDPSYKKFVFDDADKMVRLMYQEKDALYPDYVGALYYHYGDFPYTDGARYEGLTAAYELAQKTGEKGREETYFEALRKAAWAALHLCNTPESVYAVPKPEMAIGGIRFKHTRQWFRIDTLQHVAAFYLKFLPSLESKLSQTK